MKIWRRSYSIPPPCLDSSDKKAPHNDPKYARIPKSVLPLTESLKTTGERTLPFFYDYVMGSLFEGKRPLVVAHGNSLRSIVKVLEGYNDKEIVDVNIPTGVPLVYNFDKNLHVI